MTKPVALTIAGSDCSGGAGIQADLKTMTANGVFAMSAITALTAQNTTGVRDILEASPEFLGEQIDAIFEDIRPDAVKIGMVSSSDLIAVIADRLRSYNAEHIVVDPVMVATSGSALMKTEAIDALVAQLFPLAEVVTPNIPEAEVLSGMPISSASDMESAARMIGDLYGCAVLVKGGHLINDANDLLYDHGKMIWFEGQRIDNPNTHGTGCTLSSAIASNLAKGFTLIESVARAKKYISRALSQMLDLGEGSGPMDHGFDIRDEFAKLYEESDENRAEMEERMAVEEALDARASTIQSTMFGASAFDAAYDTLMAGWSDDYDEDEDEDAESMTDSKEEADEPATAKCSGLHDDRKAALLEGTVSGRLLDAAEDIWMAYNEHPFVKGIEDGTLDREKFRFYMIQDYLYLAEYAKTFAIGVAKAKSLATANLFAKYISVMNGELDVHHGYLGRFGVSQEEVDSTPRSLDNLSYTSYMLRVAYDEGEAEILAAILSCAYSYEVIAKRMIANNPASVNDPFYGEWIEGYASEGYASGNIDLIETLNALTMNYDEKQITHLIDIFCACSRYEMMFWQMSWEQRF